MDYMNDKHMNDQHNNQHDLGSKLNELAHKLRYLRRSRNDKVFGGVAGGIAELFGVETVVLRIAIVVLSVMSGVGFFAYLLAWALMAKAPEDQSFGRSSEPSFRSNNAGDSSHQGHRQGSQLGIQNSPKKIEGRQLMAVAVVSIGVLSLFNRMGINFNGDVLWPLALIGIGSAVLFSKSSNHQDRGDGGLGGGLGGGPGLRNCAQSGEPSMARDFAPSVWPAATIATDSSVASERLNPYPTDGTARQGLSGTLTPDAPPVPKPTPDDLLNQARREVDALSFHESWLENPIGSVRNPAATAVQVGAANPRASKKFSRMILGITLVVGGLFAIAIRSGWIIVGTGIDNVLAIALIGVGVVVFTGAWFGRPFGFLNLGALLFVLLATASFVGAKWGDGVGQRTYQPKSLQELRDRYQLGAGTLKVDLTKIDFSKAARTVDVRLGAGAVAVEVPADTTVAVATATRGGEVTLFGQTNDQTSRRFRIGDAAKAQLTLNVRAGVGAIEVARAGKLKKLTHLDNGSFSFNFGSDATHATDATAK